eukprot:TRINITY_DN8361_c0_g2_i2.p1 TRINITY_DN8361_c0_g2~~TRINITY_DN8361_c0_g2_i2.p1  ORF type:complete len:416 (-),score=88.20 TRINITY_DN8361_c0_g2_i2:400-1647(-)
MLRSDCTVCVRALGADRRCVRCFVSVISLVFCVSGVLEFSNLEKGTVVLDEARFSLTPLIHDVVKRLTPFAQSRSNTVDVIVDSNVPNFLIGDRRQLGRLLSILLENAIKFTQNGRTAIVVKRLHAAPGERRVELLFRVEDTGIGIAEKDQSRIFDLFSQADDSNTRQFGGVGMGLATAVRIAKLFATRLKLDSQQGVGSTFSFALHMEVSRNPIAQLAMTRRAASWSDHDVARSPTAIVPLPSRKMRKSEPPAVPERLKNPALTVSITPPKETVPKTSSPQTAPQSPLLVDSFRKFAEFEQRLLEPEPFPRGIHSLTAAFQVETTRSPPSPRKTSPGRVTFAQAIPTARALRMSPPPPASEDSVAELLSPSASDLFNKSDDSINGFGEGSDEEVEQFDSSRPITTDELRQFTRS